MSTSISNIIVNFPYMYSLSCLGMYMCCVSFTMFKAHSMYWLTVVAVDILKSIYYCMPYASINCAPGLSMPHRNQ